MKQMQNSTVQPVDTQQFIQQKGMLTVNAPAKINLSLLIAGKRPDGFHEIKTIMAKVNYFDRIYIKKAEKPGIHFNVTGPKWAPYNEKNLVYKAAKNLIATAKINPAITITLEKNIPAGSGLGSASSDAAATLLGVRKFLALDVSDNLLLQLASQLGSDVPFFLGPPMSLCTGKGEKLKPIEKKYTFLALLALPNVNVSTAEVYKNYSHNNHKYCTLDSQINELLVKNRIDYIASLCTNMLKEPCFCLNPKLAELKKNIEDAGIEPVCLSGSGAALFHIVTDGDLHKARHYKSIIQQKLGCDCVIASNTGW